MNQQNFIESSIKQFLYYKELGHKAMAQLSDEEIFDENSKWINNISIIVKHLHGNMMSRWTDFLNTDGEKEWRNRDGEFEFNVKTRKDLMKLWEEGWTQVFKAMEEAKKAEDDQIVYIRNQGHTVSEAIVRQMAHYAYHVGQIVYIAKQNKQNEWKSLSIPRGDSEKFNTQKFKKVKAEGHFTDDLLKSE